MAANSQQPKGRDGTISSLNVAIEALNLAKEAASVTPAKAVFGSVSILLTMIKVRFLLLQSDGPCSDVVRIRWPTNWTTSSSGWNVLISVERSIGG